MISTWSQRVAPSNWFCCLAWLSAAILTCVSKGTSVSWTRQCIENILDIWIFMCKVTMAQKLWVEQQKYGITFMVIELKLIRKHYLGKNYRILIIFKTVIKHGEGEKKHILCLLLEVCVFKIQNDKYYLELVIWGANTQENKNVFLPSFLIQSFVLLSATEGWRFPTRLMFLDKY